MAWVKMKDPLGNVLTIPEKTYNDVYKHNSAYTLIAGQSVKKEAPIAQKTKKMEGKDDGTVHEVGKTQRND